ncbi:acyltransferase [Clostridium intestinale]|uniref:Chloramphenicol acetyltransferase n=1 Tax=Clostridium intestinale DSM 6191 TaxID=1121320 RepID=A0A1M6DLD6_9CLOT|nr:acyltransferase [Clostridium intestinale]SHI73808.1 galactoside O-acetyltransferase [Clostridium intestinale DSM 6191]
MDSFYSRDELNLLGLKQFGDNVLISKKASIYSPEKICLGNNVRIDDFCILSGNIIIKDYVHIAAYCGLFAGNSLIFIDSFTTMSSRGAIYAISDDYSGEYMTNPMIRDEFRNIQEESVKIGKHVIIGTNSTILPGVKIEEGCSFGACSLILEDCEEWTIYVGIPIKKIRKRKNNLLRYEEIINSER